MGHAFTLFTKNLMEEGVEREKVKKASDKLWAILGEQSAGRLKPLFGDTISLSSLEQAGLKALPADLILQQMHTIARRIQPEGQKPADLTPPDRLIAFVPQALLHKLFKDRIRLA